MEFTPRPLEVVKKLFANAHTKEFLGHKKKIHHVAWNSDGRKLASGSVDQTARVWHIGHPSKDLELKGHEDSVDQLCWNPKDANQLATASSDKTVRIWDTRTGNCTHRVNTSGENINISWSPDANTIAVGNKDDAISLIDVNQNFKVTKTMKFAFEVNEITWNNDGTLFFITTGNGTVEVVKLGKDPSFKIVRTIQAHTANVYCIEFDPTGRYFAIGGADALVSLWDVNEMVCVRTFGRLDWPVRTLSFSCDGQLLASASEDLTVDISQVDTGEHVHSIACDAAMNAVAWHPKEQLLAFAGDEKDKHAEKHRESGGIVRVFGFKDRQ